MLADAKNAAVGTVLSDAKNAAAFFGMPFLAGQCYTTVKMKK